MLLVGEVWEERGAERSGPEGSDLREKIADCLRREGRRADRDVACT